MSALVGAGSGLPVVAADELPLCDPSLRATTFTGPVALVKDCPFDGEVIVSFIVKANGRTTNIVVETVRGGRGTQSNLCLSDYVRAFVRGFRFPKRDLACRHVMPFNFTEKS